jgi:membrane protein DedA with SNARE-associated domain
MGCLGHPALKCGSHGGEEPLLGRVIEHSTYAGIFLVLFAAGIGLPIPEEMPIITAGVLAHQQIVRWWIALPVCFAGVLAGDTALYWIGRHWGEQILDWWPVRLVLTREREEALKAGYRRHGVKIVLAARHVVGLRAAALLTAGIAHVPFMTFLLVDMAAAAVGVSLGFGVAYLFTDQVQQLMADVHRVERWLIVLALAAALAWFAARAWCRGPRRPSGSEVR